MRDTHTGKIVKFVKYENGGEVYRLKLDKRTYNDTPQYVEINSRDIAKVYDN